MGGPLHLLTFYYTVRAVKQMYPIEQMRDGDYFIHNDPYTGGTVDVPDVLIVTPVFVGGEVIGFVLKPRPQAGRGWARAGFLGRRIARDLPRRSVAARRAFLDEDGVVKEVLEIIKTNCRIPEIIEGDLRAQVGCTLMGVQQVRALCDEYGVDTIKAAIPAIMALSKNACATGWRTLAGRRIRGGTLRRPRRRRSRQAAAVARRRSPRRAATSISTTRRPTRR